MIFGNLFAIIIVCDVSVAQQDRAFALLRLDLIHRNTPYIVFFKADYNNILRLMAHKCVFGIKIGIIFRIYQLLNRALIFIFVRVPQ